MPGSKSELTSVKNANIDNYPKPPSPEQKAAISEKQFTIGDLHGNFMKGVYFLVREGILALEKGRKTYNKLNKIYNTPPAELTAEQINELKTILDNATINMPGHVRFIGDELADRGNNDYFTLLLLKKLREGKVPTTILLSNHAAEYLADQRRFEPLHRSQGVSEDQAGSITAIKREFDITV